jgi:hypothetical protein
LFKSLQTLKYPNPNSFVSIFKEITKQKNEKEKKQKNKNKSRAAFGPARGSSPAAAQQAFPAHPFPFFFSFVFPPR